MWRARRSTMSEDRLTLGQYFKQEREKREITLKEIEQTTKIPAQTLKFLEEDQIDVLPPRAFLRGFLQVISKEFGFDEEELVKHLDETLSSHGKREEARSRFMGKSKGTSPLMRILFIVILLVILAAAIGLSMRTCRQTYQGFLDTHAFAAAENPGSEADS
jgi:cytoskeletal protein RodZ